MTPRRSAGTTVGPGTREAGGDGQTVNGSEDQALESSLGADQAATNTTQAGTEPRMSTLVVPTRPPAAQRPVHADEERSGATDRPTLTTRFAGARSDRPDDLVNILLVDDKPANLVALEAMLQGLRQNLIKANSGREVLKWLLTHDFAVVLLDVKMPEMDGFETATLIRERDKSRHTPIIFLTAADKSQTQAVRGYAVGAVDYLVKPIVPEFVRSKVAVFVELAKKNELLRRQADLLRASEQEARELAESQAELVRDLEHKNRELESFSYAVSHDLRAPLRRIESFSQAVQDSHADRLDEAGRHYLERVREASQQMSQLIDDVLYLARVTRTEM